MKSEKEKTNTPLEEQIKLYIESCYPTRKSDVGKMYGELRSFASVRPRMEVIYNEFEMLEDLAHKRGILDLKTHGPNQNLPTRLAALKQFEDKFRHPTVRKLDASNYVRLLALAEMVTAKRGQGRDAMLHEPGFLATHTKRAIDLMGFYKKLNK